MRVGILTYHFSDNFGALMQAYGLRQWLLAQGVKAEFINYHPAHVEAGGLTFDRGAKAFLKSAYLTVSQARQRAFGDRTKAAEFARFQMEALGVDTPRLRTAAEMAELEPFDLIICGSDQIWNPSDQRGLDPVYFAHFPGSHRARRISYAASFGKGSLAVDHQPQAAALIGDLDAVAVRESSGVDIVRSLTGREALMVPDPTILLSDFDSLVQASPSLHHGHVFCYALRTSEGVREAAMVASKLCGGPILSPDNPHRRWREIGQTVHPSPGQWVSMIDAAAYVVTNSFHGVALSLLRRRPFVSVALPGVRAGLSERVRNLLKQVGLDDRLVQAGDPQAVQSCLGAPIDWDAVQGRLVGMKSTGEAYLKAQLAKASAA